MRRELARVFYRLEIMWCRRGESNPRPRDYEPLVAGPPRVAGGGGKWRQVAGYIGWKKGYGKALSAPDSCLRSCFHDLLKQKVTTSHYKGFRLTRTVKYAI